MVARGLFVFALWLSVGFAFTELTVLALNAWLLNDPSGSQAVAVASFTP